MIALFSSLGGRSARWFYYCWGNTRAMLSGVRLGAGASVSPRADIRGVAFLGNVVIGAGVKMGPGTYMGSGSIDSGSIGAYCSIGYGVHIGPTEHETNHWTTSPFLIRDLKERTPISTRTAKPPRIGSDVWIGAGSIILRNSVIGDGSIIGAGSVVRGFVPSYEIWAGVPAKFIRTRFLDSNITNDMRRNFENKLSALGIDIEKWSCCRKGFTI